MRKERRRADDRTLRFLLGAITARCDVLFLRITPVLMHRRASTPGVYTLYDVVMGGGFPPPVIMTQLARARFPYRRLLRAAAQMGDRTDIVTVRGQRASG